LVAYPAGTQAGIVATLLLRRASKLPSGPQPGKAQARLS
jgi:hypothetical protein